MVMRRNAMAVNLRQSILKSFGRYIAIVLIIALGSALFVGLVMTKSDMVHTGAVYMDRQNMFDLRLVSTLGWERDQVEAVKTWPEVTAAEGILYLDLISKIEVEDNDNVFRFYTLPGTINQVALRAGRMPEGPDEILADGYIYGENILGTRVEVTDLNDADTLEDVTQRSFTVVGIVSTPLYMDMNRGTTSVGSGVVKSYFYVLPQVFDADYYTEIHLTLAQDHVVYTDPYNDYLEQQIDLFEPMAEALGDAHYTSIRQDADVAYRQGYEQYLEGITQYMDGRVTLYRSLERAKDRLEQGEKDLRHAGDKLIQAEKDLQATEVQLENGMNTLLDQQAQLDQRVAYARDNVDAAAADADAAKTDMMVAAGALEQNPGDENLQAAFNAARQTYIDAYTEHQTLVGILNAAPSLYATIESNRLSILAGWEKVEDGWAEVVSGWEDIHEAEEDIAQGWIDLEEARQEGEEDLLEARLDLLEAHEDLVEAAEEIADIEQPEVFVLDRSSNAGYNSLDSASDIVQGVSRVIPVFFLVVAALVCITTMTRMIDEERTQIGTLKALGYSNGAIISKYLIYAGSGAVVGCGLGVLLGSMVFPAILWEAYKVMLYVTEDVIITFNWWLCGIVVSVYTALMLFVTWYSCRKALQEQPAELIRPKSPDPGKQLLVEKLPLWRRLGFLNKVMIRNIFRYKQRLAMMLLGIGGCTALLLTGFGVRDSIMDVVNYQYENVTVYDMEVYFTGHQSETQQRQFLKKVEDRAEKAIFFHQSSVDITSDALTKEIYMISAGEGVTDFIDLHRGEEQIPLPGLDELVLSVGAAEALDVKIGDTVTLRNADLQVLTVRVSGIYDNHVNNYCLVSPQTIEKQWGEPPEQQMAYITVPDGADAYSLSADISDMDRVMNVVISEDFANFVGKMLQALDMVVWVIVLSAGLLAAIVLYNLTNININERIREIATIKVLGFNASETASYVFKENLTLTVVGGLFGLLLGEMLLAFVMAQIKVDMVWFSTILKPISYCLSFVLTIVAAFIVNFIFYFKLDTINMAEALKSVE